MLTSDWDNFLDEYAAGNKRFVQLWDRASRVADRSAPRTFPSSEIHKHVENNMELECYVLFLTPEEYTAHFEIQPSEVEQKFICWAKLTDVMLGSQKTPSEGILLRPDPYTTLTLNISDLNPGEVRISLDNSIWAFRKVRITRKLGYHHNEEVLSKATEFLSKQAPNIMSFLAQDECNNRPKEPTACAFDFYTQCVFTALMC